jgi:hypothetical protein
VSFRVSGEYFESCNCEAICPCRQVGPVAPGRSTHGICFGLLSWLIADGRVDAVDLAGLAVALAVRYDDDEPGSPWTVVLYVDERGDDEQREALADVFLGRLGGPHISRLPWVRKARHLVDVRPAAISLEPDGRGYRLRVGERIAAVAVSPVETDVQVACGIPGYDRPGLELVAEELRVADEPFAWELSGNCAFATDFDYRSE